MWEASSLKVGKTLIKEAQRNREQMQESRRIWEMQYSDSGFQVNEPQNQRSSQRSDWLWRGDSTLEER